MEEEGLLGMKTLTPMQTAGSEGGRAVRQGAGQEQNRQIGAAGRREVSSDGSSGVREEGDESPGRWGDVEVSSADGGLTEEQVRKRMRQDVEGGPCGSSAGL